MANINQVINETESLAENFYQVQLPFILKFMAVNIVRIYDITSTRFYTSNIIHNPTVAKSIRFTNSSIRMTSNGVRSTRFYKSAIRWAKKFVRIED